MSRIRILLASVALIAGTVTLSVPAHAVCIPASFPANWLELQEELGGHTIARHVHKTDIQLINRLLNVSQLSTAGSFPDKAAAQGTITAGLATNRKAINTWAARARVQAMKAYSYVAAPPVTIGRVAFRPNTPQMPKVVTTCTFQATFMATGGGNCYLFTASPTLPGSVRCQ